MSFNIELAGTGVQVMHWQMYGCRGGAGFLPPTVVLDNKSGIKFQYAERLQNPEFVLDVKIQREMISTGL